MSSELGDLIYSFRKENDMTLTRLAELSGVSKGVLSKIENGETQRPGYTTWKRLAKILNIPHTSVISSFIETTNHAETLKILLEEVIESNYETLVKKVAQKFLESPKMDTFISLDYLLQYAKNTNNQQVKLNLYDIIIFYTRNRGVPFYLAKALYERYLIERDDFVHLEETYRRGRELMYYVEHLHQHEYVEFYCRLGIHAFALREFSDCIYLCKKGIEKNNDDSPLKAEALTAIIGAYLYMDSIIAAEVYLREYEKSQFADYKKLHIRAMIHSKNGQYEEAIKIYKECINAIDQERRISIIVDLFDVYVQIGDSESIKALIKSENDFLPLAPVKNPRRVEKVAKYYQLKGLYEFDVERFEEGTNSLLESASAYQKIGDYKESMNCIGHIFNSFKNHGKVISVRNMEKISNACYDLK